MEVGLGPGHIVLNGDPAPLPKEGAQQPPLSAHFYCGQTTGCIKISLQLYPLASFSNYKTTAKRAFILCFNFF